MNVAHIKLVYSIKEAAFASGLSPCLIRKRVNSGALPARREGARILILRDDLAAYLCGLPLVVKRESSDAA